MEMNLMIFLFIAVFTAIYESMPVPVNLSKMKSKLDSAIKKLPINKSPQQITDGKISTFSFIMPNGGSMGNLLLETKVFVIPGQINVCGQYKVAKTGERAACVSNELPNQGTVSIGIFYDPAGVQGGQMNCDLSGMFATFHQKKQNEKRVSEVQANEIQQKLKQAACDIVASVGKTVLKEIGKDAAVITSIGPVKVGE